MGIGAVIGKLFGTEKAVAAATDAVVNTFDKLVYTKEEMAEDERKSVTEGRQILLEWIKNSQGQNIARRVLAFGIAGTWLSMYLGSFVMAISAVWAEAQDASQIQASATVVGAYADQMSGAMMLILGFYFAAPHLDKFVAPFVERFGKRGT